MEKQIEINDLIKMLLADRPQKIQIGSIWTIEHIRDGEIINSEVHENVVPDAFINYALATMFTGGTAYSTWYILLFSDNYTPIGTETYAVPGFTEATGYDETVRQTWNNAGVSAKSITNEANRAEFTMDGTSTTIYGCGLVNVNTKGDKADGTGVLGPFAQFASAITGIQDDDIIRVYVTVTGTDV